MLTRCIRLAAFLSFVFLCFLRLNTLSFGIALDIAGVCGHMGMTHEGDRCRALGL